MPTPEPTPRTGAELLVEALVRHGVEVVFGVPGDTGIAFYDELARRQDDVRHVLCRDERHAAYMADGYARSSQRLGVCEASSGAGAVYLASGLGEASASSIPVLAVTTDIQQGSRGTNAITEIDQRALFSAFTKRVLTARRASQLPGLVAEAVELALGERPGPVALVVPEDVLDETGDATFTLGTSEQPGARTQASRSQAEQVATLLTQAERPAVLAGGGVHASSAWESLRTLAEHAALPVATTIHGKGALAEDHPLSLGVAGGNGSRGYANDWLRDADVVMVVGSRANSTDTDGFTVVSRTDHTVVQVDADPQQAGNNFPGAVRLVGDAATVLEQVRSRLPVAADELRAERTGWIRDAAEAWRGATREDVAVPDGVLLPRDLVQTLHGVFGADQWVTADPGTPTPNLAAYWETGSDAWRVMIPRGHGPMGWAISSAIGVSVAHPGERVLCLTTESSLAMGVGDWETAARLALPITFVVVDNQSMAWIKMLQHLYLDRRYFGVEPGPLDPVLLAQGMGLTAARAHDGDELLRLVKEAADSPLPSVVHVRVPEHDAEPPPVSAWQRVLSGASTGRPVY